MHRPRRRVAAVLGALALVAGAATLGTYPANAAPTSATTIVVDANQPLRPVTHVASGGLYGLDTATIPADGLVEPLHPNTFVQMAPGGSQLPNGEPVPGGDALIVAPEAAKAGAKVVIRMPDWYPNFPYKWISWSNWLAAVDTQIGKFRSSGAGNIAAWELWNEPDGTWNTAAAGSFDAGWARTFAEVRSKDATTPIQGPSFSHWDLGLMTTFLKDAVASSAVPNIVSWHELQSASTIAADVAAYRGLEKSLGLSPRPIAIEEYATRSEVGVPGPLAGYIAKFERAGVHDAELAFWNHYGTLGDTLTDTGGAPNGAYWLYQWYGSMTGNMLTTVPPAQTGIDGAASLNGAGNQIQVIFGGGAGSSAVRINGLSAFGTTVHVQLEYSPSFGRTNTVSGPIVISSTDYAVSGGSITVPVVTNASDGYHLVITSSGSSTTLAGRYQITDMHSGLALDTVNAGTAQGTAVVQATPTTGTDQNWTLTAAGTGLYKIVNQKSGLVLGIGSESTSDGGTALIWGDNGTPDHLWQLIPAPGGRFKIANFNSGLVLGVSNESTANGAQVVQWDDNGTPDHLWTLTTR
jgi:hypothetical protein